VSDRYPDSNQPTRHADSLEKEQRIERAVELIVRVGKVSQIIGTLEREFGIQRTQAYEYLRWARERIKDDALRARQEHVAELVGYYKAVMTAEGTRTGDKLRAAQGLRQLLGLDAPTKQQIEVTALDKYSEAELKELAEKVGLKGDPESPNVEVPYRESHS
jgi:hypothetical protein